MNKYLLGGLVAVAAMSAATNANATLTTTYEASTAFNPHFYTDDSQVADGILTSSIGQTAIGATDFLTNFVFYVPFLGSGSGSVTSNVTFRTVNGSPVLITASDLDFTRVFLTAIAGGPAPGTSYNSPVTPVGSPLFDSGVLPGVSGAAEQVAVSSVTLTPGTWYSLVVSGIGRGAGRFGGEFGFFSTPASVPESSTWAMMILGMGAVGYAMRRRRQSVNSLRVTYA
jgi:hypothetical protein